MKVRWFDVALLLLPLLSDVLFGSCSFHHEWLSNNNNSSHAEPPFLELTQHLLLLSALAGNVTFLSFLDETRGSRVAAAYDYYRFFNAEPSQAVIAASHGYCFVGFRGTILTAPDLLINLLPGFDSVCGTATTAGGEYHEQEVCCDVRTPFNREFNAPFRRDLERALQECLATHASPCQDEHGCVVLTGFSQGGAIAGVASLHLTQLNPYVITFGEPASLGKKNCSLARTDKWFRYVNTWNNYLLTGTIGYDYLSVQPFALDTRQVGHMIVFPSKRPFDNSTSSGLAYLGLDPDESVYRMKPISLEAHDIVESTGESVQFHPGYLNHLTFLMNSEIEFPFVIDGFADGYQCTQDRECKSGRCQRQHFASRACG